MNTLTLSVSLTQLERSVKDSLQPEAQLLPAFNIPWLHMEREQVGLY